MLLGISPELVFFEGGGELLQKATRKGANSLSHGNPLGFGFMRGSIVFSKGLVWTLDILLKQGTL